MSLLADKDVFIHSLRLSYLRHVLPSHAPHSSSIPGTGSYDLIAFDPLTLEASPYIVAAGWNDETRWPELASGRSSPPLATTLARSADGAAAGAGGGRSGRRSGPGALGYRETIYGKSSGSTAPGMRVGGRQRALRTRRATGGEGNDEFEEVEKAEGSLKRSSSLEASLHRRRLEESSINLGQPPPVVVHSPVATPQGSRTNRHSTSSTGPMSPAHPNEFAASELAQAANASPELEPAEGVGATAMRAPRTARFADEHDLPLESPIDPPSETELSSELSLSQPSRLSQSHLSTDSGLLSEESVPEGTDTSPSSIGPRYASVASSGVSLFGVSRLGSSEGVLGTRDRSDSDTSFPSPALPDTPALPESMETNFEAVESSAAVGALTPAHDTTTTSDAPPPFAIPARYLRAPRERRRVNISGRLLVPITEPVHEEDSTPGPKPQTPTVAEAPADAKQEDTTPGSYQPPKASEDVPPEVATMQRKDSGPPSLKINTSVGSRPPSGVSSPLAAATGASPNTSPSNSRRHPPRSTTNAISFSKRQSPLNSKAPAAAPARSNLSALLNSKSDSASGSNPFSTLYAALISRASDALKLSIYFPGSDKPSVPIKIGVKRDLTVEEVIGAGLWAYWEEGREPKLELAAGTDGEHDETTKWNLRIVEDDGEVDEDFPALDRTRAIAKFSFGEFAIVKATGTQVKDNQTAQATITRRPSRVLAGPKRTALTIPTGNTLAPPAAGGQTVPMSPLGPPALSSTAGVSSSLAIGVLLRIQLPAPPGVGVDAINTTINVPSDMYINDVLEHVCKKRNLEPPRDWAFIVRHHGTDIVVPLDRMVESLGEKHDLRLVRRSEITGLKGAGQINQPQLQNTNPSASIFKRLSEPGQPKYQSASELAATYRRYNVMRKLPMPLGRHPRIIAIDGDYIHFLPSDSKGDVFSAGRTTSFHISMLRECRLSRRSPLAFKILVQKDRVEKCYDFEAESAKQAHEIVHNVKTLMASYKAEELAKQQRQGGFVVGAI